MTRQKKKITIEVDFWLDDEIVIVDEFGEPLAAPPARVEEVLIVRADDNGGYYARYNVRQPAPDGKQATHYELTPHEMMLIV